MPAAVLTRDVASRSATVPSATDQVDIQVDELIIGRPLESPVYDSHGILLLAGGNVITAEFKRLLAQRGTGSVRVSASDAERVRFQTPDVDDTEQAISLDSQIATQLDRMIESGPMLVQNSGPAMKETVVCHGLKGYNAQRRDELIEQRTASSDSIGLLMKDAVHGKAVSSTAVTQMAVQFLSAAAADTDCVLSVAMEATRERVLADHCVKMATLGMAIAVEMGLDEENCKRVFISGLIHDWGMAKIPPEIRNAPHLLSDHHFYQIRKHPIYTAEMIERMPGIPSIVPIVVYQVHERPNGGGYPRGRSGDRIHLFARILAVADVYSALTESRPHRQLLAPYAAMECLIRLAKTRDVDPDVVRALLKVMTLFPIGSYVALDDRSVARVLRRNGDKYATPLVQVVQDPNGRPVTGDAPDRMVDLSAGTRSVLQALPTPGRSEALLTDSILCPIRPRS